MTFQQYFSILCEKYISGVRKILRNLRYVDNKFDSCSLLQYQLWRRETARDLLWLVMFSHFCTPSFPIYVSADNFIRIRSESFPTVFLLTFSFLCKFFGDWCVVMNHVSIGADVKTIVSLPYALAKKYTHAIRNGYGNILDLGLTHRIVNDWCWDANKCKN